MEQLKELLNGIKIGQKLLIRLQIASFSKYYVDGRIFFFDMPIKNDEEKFEQSIEMGRKNDYAQAIYWVMNTFQSITN